MILKWQAHASQQRWLPVEANTNGWKVWNLSETVQLYYFNSTTLTIDAWQAAWVLVVWKLSYWQIQNKIWAWIATDLDSSLIVTSTALKTLEESTNTTFEAFDWKSLMSRLSSLADWLSNWEYVVDYSKGIIYGKKFDNSKTLVVTYSAPSSIIQDWAYLSKVVRTTAVLTDTYVAGTVISPVDSFNQLLVYVKFTKSGASSGQIKIEFSDDGTNYYQETFSAISAWISTDTLWEHTLSTSGSYRIAVPIKDKYIKISSKVTWTVTTTDMLITAILSNV